MKEDILLRARAQVVKPSQFYYEMVVEVTADEFYEMIHEIERLRGRSICATIWDKITCIYRKVLGNLSTIRE
jgi:hypothetical protein